MMFFLESPPFQSSMLPYLPQFQVLCGTEKERENVKNLIEKYKLEELLKIKNPVPILELAKIKKGSFAVIIPSLTEGFGFSAAETSALDVPVISSDAGSLPEVISRNFLFFKNGNIDDLSKKIILATENKFYYIPYRKFNWNESIEKMITLYEKLLKI